MEIKNGKIAKATENELFTYYLNRGFDDLMSFTDYKRRCIELGTEVIEEAAVKKANKIIEDLGIKLKHFAEFLAEAEKKNEELKAENERLSVELSAMRGSANSYKMHYEKAKAEAIKKFAARLKIGFIESQNTGHETFSNRFICGAIDEVIEEMVGDNK